jgi:hypothetical protein
MGKFDYPKGACLTAPRMKQGASVLIQTDVTIGRALRRYLQRQDRIQRKRMTKGVAP